mmetsp:Transcript_21595/g.27969  ORF Transcript_21595/g.27969 Transcript_21595/m.27969 type:complete len:570 (+) Transcript_21595:466-2175(+)
MDYAKIDHMARVNNVPRALSAGQYSALMSTRVKQNFDEILTSLKITDNRNTSHVQQTELWQIMKTYAINIPFDEFVNMLRVLGLAKGEAVNYRLFLSMFNKKAVINDGKNFQQLVPAFCLAQTCSKIQGRKGEHKHKLTEFEEEFNRNTNAEGLISKRDFRLLLNKYTGAPVLDHEFEACCHSYADGDFIRAEPYLKTLKKYALRIEITAAKSDELQQPQSTIKLGHYHMNPQQPGLRKIKSRFDPNGFFIRTSNQIRADSARLTQALRRGGISEGGAGFFEKSGLTNLASTGPAAFNATYPPPENSDGFTRSNTDDSSLSPNSNQRSSRGLPESPAVGHHFFGNDITSPSRPATSGSGIPRRTRRGIPLISPLKVQTSTAVAVESRLKQEVASRWKVLNQCFHQIDEKNSGLVPIARFKAILEGAGILLEPQDMQALVFKYGDRRSRNIEYKRFLNFMMKNGTGDGVKLATPRKAQQPESADAEEPSEAALSQIGMQWKEIRKSLKEFDPDNKGHVELQQLQSVLHYYNVDLNSDQIKLILRKFGTKRGKKVAYDKFLRTHLSANQRK